MSWKVILSKQATKDAKKIAASGLKSKTQKLLAILESNPKVVKVLRMWTHYG